MGRFVDLKAVAFAVFLMAGNFKADPRLAWLPVDLTMLAGAIVVLLCVKSFVEHGFTVPERLHWMVALFFLFAIPLFWTDFQLAYPLEKTEKMFSFTLLASFAPFFLFREPADFRRFLNVVSLLGLVIVVEAASKLGSGGPMLRLTAFDANTIALGRASGLVLVWYAILALEARLPALLAIPIICLAAVIMLFSGSRGPCLSAIGILGILGLAFYRARVRQLLLFGATLGVVGVVLYFSMAYAPMSSLGRIETFFSGELRGSELERVRYYVGAWELLQRHPLGLGWGSVAIELGSHGGALREYPHNFMFETVVEAGWLAGIWLVVVIGTALRRIMRLSSTAEARGILALLLFMIFNASVSGDLTDNRLMFCLLGCCLAYVPREEAHASREAPEPEPEPGRVRSASALA